MKLRVVRAQCSQPIFNINSTEAADAIQDCEILEGQVHIDLSNANGTFHLDSVRNISGHLTIHTNSIDLIIKNAGDEAIQAVGLSMSSLEGIRGKFEATNTTNLASISLPVLVEVEQMVHLHNLPNLATVSLPSLNKVAAFVLDKLPSLRDLELDAGISEITGYVDQSGGSGYEIDPFVVVESTGLTKLESFNFSTVAIFQITNNWNLESISMPLKETTRANSWALMTNEISGNGNSNATLSLPHLWKFDTEITEFHDLASIDLPRLQKIEGSLVIGDNHLLKSFNASMLTEISNDLTIEWNSKLSSITFPVLTTVNSLIAQGTKALARPDGLSMPKLRAVKEVYIGGDGSRINCQLWDNKRCTGIVDKVYSCGPNWRHHRKIDIARNPDNCRFIHPSHGWTRARKIRVCTRFVLAVAILTVILSTCIYYRHTLRNTDYRNILRNAMAGEYMRVDDEEEDESNVESHGRDVERRDTQQAGGRNKPLPDKPLPASPI